MTDHCEWCLRPVPTNEHHIAQGFRKKTDHIPGLKVRLCIECHTTSHALPGQDGRALGLVLSERAGRGRNLWLMWSVTDRQWPSEECVELWRKRLGVS